MEEEVIVPVEDVVTAEAEVVTERIGNQIDSVGETKPEVEESVETV